MKLNAEHKVLSYTCCLQQLHSLGKLSLVLMAINWNKCCIKLQTGHICSRYRKVLLLWYAAAHGHCLSTWICLPMFYLLLCWSQVAWAKSIGWFYYVVSSKSLPFMTCMFKTISFSLSLSLSLSLSPTLSLLFPGSTFPALWAEWHFIRLGITSMYQTWISACQYEFVSPNSYRFITYFSTLFTVFLQDQSSLEKKRRKKRKKKERQKKWQKERNKKSIEKSIPQISVSDLKRVTVWTTSCTITL